MNNDQIFIEKPTLPKDPDKRAAVIKAIFEKWVVDVPNRKLKPNSGVFVRFFGYNEYRNQLDAFCKDHPYNPNV